MEWDISRTRPFGGSENQAQACGPLFPRTWVEGPLTVESAGGLLETEGRNARGRDAVRGVQGDGDGRDEDKRRQWRAERRTYYHESTAPG